MLTPAELSRLLQRYGLPPRRLNWPLLLRGWADELLRAALIGLMALALLRLLGLY